jgi:hypothetical protein
MPLTIDQFKNIANSTAFDSRDIALAGKGKNATAKLGNLVFSQGKALNDATMAAFRATLAKEYGVFGANAFDSTLGARREMHKSLRAMDVRQTLSNLSQMRSNRFVAEINRQLDTSPQLLSLSADDRKKIHDELAKDALKGTDLSSCRTAADVGVAAQKRIAAAMEAVRKDSYLEPVAIGPRKHLESEVSGTEPTGLRNLKTVFGKDETSIADLVKRGLAGEGMRVNRSGTNPVILEKLKTNGVEPGFIYRNDWSADDTRGLMADIDSDASLRALNELKNANQSLADKCEGKTLREQIMLAGRAHPAGIAAVAEFAIQDAAQNLRSGGGRVSSGYVFKALADGLKEQFSEQDIEKIANGTADKGVIKEAKLYLFSQIRDGVMNVGAKDDYHEFSPIFKHFSDRAIVKLDYNEGDKFSSGGAAHAGTFMRPERILTTRPAVIGQIYRFQSRDTADHISAGAVTEALANDLTRVAGVPAQELEIVRGEYSDGHPKIMLAAKFANGYKDLENGLLKDGRVVKPQDAEPGLQMEKLGKYKAFFLVTADRDGIGKRGQNKGFVGGQFFAIDPGHSLEGNGKYLKVEDDLSFKDTYGTSTKPRFNNFSVFDDDTFFAKFEGVAKLRRQFEAGDFKKVFDDYRTAFKTDEEGISPAERSLRENIIADINKKETEFNENIKKILDVSANNLELYDDLADDGPAIQQGAIETVANLEKLTSPTTWVSKKGEVALEHLEVMPESRVPWKGALKGDNIVYFCETKMSYENSQFLKSVVEAAGGKCETDALGVTRVTVPKDKAAQFFAAFTEEKVQQLTHPAEYRVRKEGGDGLKEAAPWKPVPYHKPSADPRPLMSVDSLPEQIDFAVDGRVYKFPKIHYQDLISKSSSVHRPRNEGELRALLEAQVRRGFDVLGALQSGRKHLFKPTNENIVALTYALHALAIKKGEFMYRGSFSIEDKNGEIARWLDKADNLYIRTSTHAKPYQTAHVDGHLNMPRGYDVPTGAGGLLNGMRTFHYFTIPDADGLKNGGNGNGPKRRLFLKCETFGIFCSTAHAKIFDKPASVAPGMKTRGYRFGDILESICHGSSLFASLFTPKEAPGIRKENLTEVQKNAIRWAQEKLRPRYPAIAERLTAGNVLDGAGINAMVDNFNWILEHMPEDEDERAWITDVLDFMFTPMETDFAKQQSGDFANRIGNEIMIDSKDLR